MLRQKRLGSISGYNTPIGVCPLGGQRALGLIIQSRRCLCLKTRRSGRPRDDAPCPHRHSPIAEQLGLATGGAMQIYIANSQAEFDVNKNHLPHQTGLMEPLGQKMDGSSCAHLNRRGASEPLLHQVLDHEIVHILLGRAFAHYPVPRWLQEGVAQVVAGEYTPEKIAQLGSFAEPMSFLDLARGFPADRLRAQMAYAQSASVVSFLFREHGQESLHILIEEMSQGHALDVALVRATGLTPQELDVARRGRTFQVPMWLRSLSVDGTLIALVGAMVLLGSVRKYKQYRSGRPHWDEEERIHQQLVQEVATWDMSMRFH